MRAEPLHTRLGQHLMMRYPIMVTVGRFGLWSLGILKRTLFGIGGLALLVVLGLLVAAALVPPLRWYLVGMASALLLIGGGLLALSYVRYWLNSVVSDRAKQIADIKREIQANGEVFARTNVGNFPLFQRYKRRLTNEDLKRFAEEWIPKLGLDLDAEALGYIAHRICLAEDICVGRLAGHIETMVLRVLVARSVMEPNLEVLEIGTLFGVGAAMIHENCLGFFSDVHMTVIDPLDGFYDKDRLDIHTKMPVTRDTFVHNMHRMHIPESDYTIIQKLSTEDEAIEEASQKRYNLLIIDGDHSYSGVKHDFHNYRQLVQRGGYIVFDDYGHSSFPGIKQFVDEAVLGLPELELLGVDVNIAIFRVVAPPDFTDHRSSQQE